MAYYLPNGREKRRVYIDRTDRNGNSMLVSREFPERVMGISFR